MPIASFLPGRRLVVYPGLVAMDKHGDSFGTIAHLSTGLCQKGELSLNSTGEQSALNTAIKVR
jgi:hypothetical protein